MERLRRTMMFVPASNAEMHIFMERTPSCLIWKIPYH